MRLKPAEDGERHAGDQERENDYRGNQPLKSDASGEKGIYLTVARELIETEHQAQKQCDGNRLTQIMGQEVGEQLENDAKGVALAQGHIKQADHALGEENEHANGYRRQQRLGDLLQNIAVDYGHTGLIGISNPTANAILSCPAGARTARRLWEERI